MVLFPDNADPIYVDEESAFSHPQVTAFSYAEPVFITEEERKRAEFSVMYRKYIEQTPVELRPLLKDRKLAVLQSKNGKFITVVLSDCLVNN